MPDGTSTESGPGERAEVERHGGTRGAAGTAGVVAMALAALGVVFGDIGTSPLYAFETAAPGLNAMVLPITLGVLTVLNVPNALRQAAGQGLELDIDVENATYFVSQITIVRGDGPGMNKWRKKLFLALSRTSSSPVEFFWLPERRIVTMGSFIEH